MGKKKEWEGYSVESLYNGIQQAKVNVKAFEDAINRERETMANYKWMIDKIEEKKATAIAAKAMQDAVNKDIKRQNEEHKARYPNLKSVELEEEQEDGD